MKLLLSLFALLKLGKVFTTGGTMLISVFAYALIWGWRYAVGFVVLLLAHEMGHFVAARQRGLDVGAPTFIPFVGAWINMKQMPHDAETEPMSASAGLLSARWLHSCVTTRRCIITASCCLRFPTRVSFSICST